MINNNDLSVQQVSLRSHNVNQPKVLYLVSLKESNKKKLFVGISKPIIENGVLDIKGAYIQSSSLSTKEHASKILEELGPDVIVSMLFPLQNINYIQNLNYKVKYV